MMYYGNVFFLFEKKIWELSVKRSERRELAATLPKSGTNLDDMILFNYFFCFVLFSVYSLSFLTCDSNNAFQKREAIRMYKECTGKKEFQFEHCWETLRTNIHHVDNINGISKTNGIVHPQERKASKESKRKTNEDDGAVDAIKGLRSTFEKEIEFKKKNQELREELKRKKTKEKELHQKEQLEKKAQKGEEKLRIMSIDISKLPEIVQKMIESFFHLSSVIIFTLVNKPLAESFVGESRTTRETDSDK
ncbi:basic helix-loop-helix (bHLH) DNA-bindingsuperfamily protein, partial [Striga asiatica]